MTELAPGVRSDHVTGCSWTLVFAAGLIHLRESHQAPEPTRSTYFVKMVLPAVCFCWYLFKLVVLWARKGLVCKELFSC